MAIEAVIFDMDGVILDSMPMHIAIWKKMFKKRGISFSLKEFEKYNGTSTKEIGEKIIKKYRLKETAKGIVKEKQDIEKKIQDKKIRLFPKAIKTLKNLRKKGYKLALATSAMPPMVSYAKKRFLLQKYFDAIVYSTQVKHTKPAPDIFLLAAKKLRVEPKDCAVVEDAVNGVQAAKNANMCAVAITTTFKKNAFKKADIIISSLSNLEKKIGGF